MKRIKSFFIKKKNPNDVVESSTTLCLSDSNISSTNVTEIISTEPSSSMSTPELNIRAITDHSRYIGPITDIRTKRKKEDTTWILLNGMRMTPSMKVQSRYIVVDYLEDSGRIMLAEVKDEKNKKVVIKSSNNVNKPASRKTRMEGSIQQFLSDPIRREVMPNAIHIVKFHSHYHEHNRDNYHIVMEFCEKGSAHAFIEEHRASMTEPMLTGIALDIMYAVQYMHTVGVAHGDLKLDNVMLKYSHKKQRYIAKLGDFEFSSYTGKYTFSDSTCCTPEYAAPELFLKIKRHPFVTDIWALGVCLYILFEGKYPFYDDVLLVTEMRKMEILAMLICQNPLTVIYRRMKSNIEFMRLVSSMLNPNMENRPTIDECFNFPFMRTLKVQDLSLDIVRRLENISTFTQYSKHTKATFSNPTVLFGEDDLSSSSSFTSGDPSSFSE